MNIRAIKKVRYEFGVPMCFSDEFVFSKYKNTLSYAGWNLHFCCENLVSAMYRVGITKKRG